MKTNVRTPESVEEAFNFGKIQGFYGQLRLSFNKLFANDPQAGIVERYPPRSSLFNAYRRGYERGQLEKKLKAEKARTDA